MAYGNWGAFVYRDGKRMKDFEDAKVGDSMYHAVLGSDEVVLCGYKNTPALYIYGYQVDINRYLVNNGGGEDRDDREYRGEVNGYSFSAYQYNGNMIDLYLREPGGKVWMGTCGYEYGSGWMDD